MVVALYSRGGARYGCVVEVLQVVVVGSTLLLWWQWRVPDVCAPQAYQLCGQRRVLLRLLVVVA